MKKLFLVLIIIVLFLLPICYADGFDTNYVTGSVSNSSSSSSSGGSGANNYRYWDYYKTTGTRYVIRVYDWNLEKYIAVPKEYYINHVVSGSNECIYLGVDKSRNSSHTYVRVAKSIFSDNSYSHVITWFGNKNVSKFGLTQNDVKLLADIVRESAEINGNISLANSMRDVIDGVVPFDVRAEILFRMKIPGMNGDLRTARVRGNSSVEDYTFTFYANKKGWWNNDYMTYLEAKAICYAFGDDCGNTMKAYWLDKVACALYENDYDYVFSNNVYQCSCDLYRWKFGNGVSYTLNSSNKISINQQAYEPNNRSDRWYMYFVPGRCGIPINISGTTYYLTPGKTYPNVNGKQIKVDSYIKFTDTKKGIRAQNTDYLGVVTNDATHATIYEGWDYITNNLAGTLVIAVDKDTGNIISLNGVPYSRFEIVSEGNYTKTAWDISGYKYTGYLVKENLKFPSMPFEIEGTDNDVTINVSRQDVEDGVRKQVVFVYERDVTNEDKAARLSIFNLENGFNTLMNTGNYSINEEGLLSINLYDRIGDKKHTEELDFNSSEGYNINTNKLEEILDIDSENYEYVGNLIKVHPEYFLSYLGENLNSNSGDIYNLKEMEQNKVHIILGYKQKIEDIPVDEENPELKISYVDEKGNLIPDKQVKETEEKIGQKIITEAEDLKSENYMYIGYDYIDTQDKFGNIVTPLTIKGNETKVNTIFNNSNDRRHIIFVYKKVELEFDIDIVMQPNDLENQLIGQLDNEDYWVLDEAGKTILKVNVKGDEGLNILSYSVKLRIPFDTYMNGNFIKENTINNLSVSDLQNIIVADRLIVPIWVVEKEYFLDAVIEANVEGFGIVTANKKESVEVVGRLYDFTVTNLDGSKQTGDEKWKNTLFSDEMIEYKADVIPVGQRENQPVNYNYGIKLGTNFYFSLNTKGLKNNFISIVPKFIYISEDGKSIKDVDIYFNDNGKMKNILEENLSEKKMKLREDNILKTHVINEIEKAQQISKVFERYNYSTNDSRKIGNLSNIILSKYLSLPYVNYINEFKELYGVNAIELSNKTENEILLNASHWYGKYSVPASSIIVDKGASINSRKYEEGYLLVCFKVISLNEERKEYLSYDLPSTFTQWQKEKMNQKINLPIIGKDNELEENIILIETLKEGYAPVILYQVGVSINDNNTSVGTH